MMNNMGMTLYFDLLFVWFSKQYKSLVHLWRYMICVICVICEFDQNIFKTINTRINLRFEMISRDGYQLSYW